MLPENLTLGHIANAMDITTDKVLELADNPRLAYSAPRWEPHGGKMRLITKPKRSWKRQYQHRSTFLRRHFPIHTASHGSVPYRSPFTAARPHCGHRNLVCRDIKDAFPSVTAGRFYLEMLALGFDGEMAQVLTKLLLPDGYLPQGGTTSNIALDLFFCRIDAEIEARLAALGARYTRFTDGLDASFPLSVDESRVAAVIEENVARLGLRINLKKRERNGWQPVHEERVMCGVCVNSPLGTQLPKAVVAKLMSACESLYRGAVSAAPHTLEGLARRRRSLQGWLNQGSQADIAPIRDLQRRLHQVDMVIRSALLRAGAFEWRDWYTKGAGFDTAAEIARRWAMRRRCESIAVAVAARPNVAK
jgi:hypothetical protein